MDDRAFLKYCVHKTCCLQENLHNPPNANDRGWKCGRLQEIRDKEALSMLHVIKQNSKAWKLSTATWNAPLTSSAHLKRASFSKSGHRGWWSSQFFWWQFATLNFLFVPWSVLVNVYAQAEKHRAQVRPPGEEAESSSSRSLPLFEALNFSLKRCSQNTTKIRLLSSNKTTSNRPRGEKY